MRPTEHTMERTSLWLLKRHKRELTKLARTIGSNSAQLVRDFIHEGLRRKRAA